MADHESGNSVGGKSGTLPIQIQGDVVSKWLSDVLNGNLWQNIESDIKAWIVSGKTALNDALQWTGTIVQDLG